MTEKINGVSFEEYAAACANLAHGMSEDEILKTLGLEKPVWDDTLTQWSGRFGELAAKDTTILGRYGEIFANPKVGRFADDPTQAVAVADLLTLVPDLETYLKIQIHQSIANGYGFDPVTVLAGYDLDIGKWGALNMHYGKELNALLDDPTRPDFQERFEYFKGLQERWTQHFENQYSQNKVDLGEDIKF